MTRIKRSLRLAAACAGVVVAFGPLAYGQVVINELQWDDVGAPDDKEFIELFNGGTLPANISGWTIASFDDGATGAPLGINASITVPPNTFIPTGGYYVFGQDGSVVRNINQFSPDLVNVLELDKELVVLRSASGAVVDAMMYETNKTTVPHELANVPGQVGRGVWGNFQSADLSDSTIATIGRFFDGRDTNNNGRDFGVVAATPGAPNSTGVSTLYTAFDTDGLSPEQEIPGYAGTFVNARAIVPGTVSTSNPNVIPPSPQGGNAMTVVDAVGGGGNAAVSTSHFHGAGAFRIWAYLDTNDLPAGGNETTIYNLGAADALQNTPDPEGDILAITTPSAPGNTGVGGLVQKFVGRAKLYLVDFGDGGNSSPDVSPVDWRIIQSFDLSAAASAWHDLAIQILPDGTGLAIFDGNVIPFTTAPDQAGVFSIGYRETLPLTPSAGGLFRPATFDTNPAPIPEPATLSLLAAAALLTARRRRR